MKRTHEGNKEQTTKSKYTTRAKYDVATNKTIIADLPDWVCDNDKMEVEITLLERREIGCCNEDGTDFNPCTHCGIMPGAPACEDRLREEKRMKTTIIRPGKDVQETETFNSCGGIWR